MIIFYIFKPEAHHEHSKMRIFGINGCEITPQQLVPLLRMSIIWRGQFNSRRESPDIELESIEFTSGLFKHLSFLKDDSTKRNLVKFFDHLYGKYRHDGKTFWGDGAIPEMTRLDGSKVTEETLYDDIRTFVYEGRRGARQVLHFLNDGTNGREEGEDAIVIALASDVVGGDRESKNYIIGALSSSFDAYGGNVPKAAVTAAQTIFDKEQTDYLRKFLPDELFKSLPFDKMFAVVV